MINVAKEENNKQNKIVYRLLEAIPDRGFKLGCNELSEHEQGIDYFKETSFITSFSVYSFRKWESACAVPTSL